MSRNSQKKARANAKRPSLSIFAVLGVGDGGASLHQEVEVCKSALLYADHVTIASPRLFGVVAALGIVSVTPQTFSKVMSRAVRDGGEQLREVADTVAEFSAALDAMPPRHELTPEQRRQKSALTRSLDGAMEALRTTARRNLSNQGYDALVPAIQEGLLTLEPLTRAEEAYAELPTEVLLSRYLETLEGALANGRTYPLFDDSTGTLAELGLRAGYFVRTEAGLNRGVRAAAGSGLIDRLPQFPNADMSEILDIRLDLQAPLSRFRRAVVEFASTTTMAAEDPEFPAFLDDYWDIEVRPHCPKLKAFRPL